MNTPSLRLEGSSTTPHQLDFNIERDIPAAPVVSSYSAVLGSKFTRATPTQIVDRLLSTARTDTIANYDVGIHGRGEASISRALAPASIR